MIKQTLTKNQSQSYDKNQGDPLDRKRLAGRYVIICNAEKDNGILFYQDRRKKADGFWSRKMEEAYAFPSKIMADAYCKRMRYNKPIVKYVNPETCELE